jgi:phosphoenolpyruvate synthase/pyruvate phosphate dikinase
MFHSIVEKLPPEKASAEYLGGKAAGLHFMRNHGINVPFAVVFPTPVCAEYMKKPKGTMVAIKKLLPEIKAQFKSEFGDMPLLSVRSGARVSMPGMMDTLLNVGIDAKSEKRWRKSLGDECFENSYHRLVTMYGSVVKGIERQALEAGTLKDALGLYSRKTEEDFPDADEQLLNSIEAVFKSWNNERAKVYRAMKGYSDDWGTAVILQAMVFGNLGEDSATGVLFTRNPDTGADEVTGEFLVNAQGEDVVAGIRTPLLLSKMPEWNDKIASELLDTVQKLEELKRDVQDVEFTVQKGILYILQTRNAARSSRAAVKIALDMLSENLITADEAKKRFTARDIDLANQVVLAPDFNVEPAMTGLPASSGVVTGQPVFSAEEAVELAKLGQKVVLITKETTPDDIAGMMAAVGVITMEGGSTSHAAVVARGMNKPCITGVGSTVLKFKVGTVSMDGATGRIWFCDVPVVETSGDLLRKAAALKIGSGQLVVTEPPKFKVERVTLDLSGMIHWTDKALTKRIKETAAMCNALTVLVSEDTAKASPVLSVFLTPQLIAERIAQVRTLVLSLASDLNLSVMGWAVYGIPSVTCVTANDLASLALTKSSGVLLGVPQDEKEKAAFEKIIGWLKADGVTLAPFGVGGGYAEWAVHANA